MSTGNYARIRVQTQLYTAVCSIYTLQLPPNHPDVSACSFSSHRQLCFLPLLD